MNWLRRNWVGLVCCAIALAVHTFAALRYGYFRDELYFIACAKHLAWGYPDYPPFAAFAAWLTQPFDFPLLGLRAFPILAAAATVFVTCAIARELGGGRFAQAFAGLAALLLPMNLFVGSTLTTTSFEPFTWTLAIYLAIRIVRGAGTRAWYGLAATIAFALYAKYSILMLLVAVAIGLLAGRHRSVLANRNLGIAAICVTVVLLPNIVWQAMHGVPFLGVLNQHVSDRTAYNSGLVFQTSDLLRNAGLFSIEQILFTNPFLAIVWIVGLIALFRMRKLADARFLGIAYLVLLAVAILFSAKSYYIAGIYPALCAAGAVASCAWRVRAGAYALAAICLAAGIAFAPLSAPLLPAPGLIGYELSLGIKEARGNPPRLAQPLFAEEFGWDELAQHVASVYNSLPPDVRAHTAIFADNYGDAAALDFFGPRYGLPPAISGQDAYYLWGTRGYDGNSVLAVGGTQTLLLRDSFKNVRLVDTYLHPYRWSAEGPTPIYLCTNPNAPLSELWPRFQWYGA